MPTMHIELCFVAGEELLAQGCITCAEVENAIELEGVDGHVWSIKARYEEPSSPVELVCRREGSFRYRGALQVGVHDSEDWEFINLGNIHILGFRCRVNATGGGGV